MCYEAWMNNLIQMVSISISYCGQWNTLCMIASTRRSSFECSLTCKNNAYLPWLVANDESVATKRALCGRGNTTLPCATYSILIMLCSWFSGIISSYLIHVWTSILRPKCSLFSMNSYFKQPMITVWHNISVGRLSYRTLCNVQTHMLCITLGPARVISLEYLFATFYEANFFCIWFGLLFAFVSFSGG